MITTDLDTIFLHSKPMRLIDAVIKLDPDYIHCHIEISADNIFYDKTINGIYAWVGMEYMAQAVAAYAGSHKEQVEPSLGLLLSVRTFKTSQPYFKVGQELLVIANKEYIYDMVGVFNCEIIVDDVLVSSAKLSTIEPPPNKIEAILKGQK